MPLERVMVQERVLARQLFPPFLGQLAAEATGSRLGVVQQLGLVVPGLRELSPILVPQSSLDVVRVRMMVAGTPRCRLGLLVQRQALLTVLQSQARHHRKAVGFPMPKDGCRSEQRLSETALV